MKKRYKFTATLAAILVGILVLAGLAYAVSQSNLLDTLFKGNQPNEQAVKLVAPVGISKTQGNVSLTINEYMLDGYDLYVDWTARSEADETLLMTLAPIVRTDTNTALGGDDVLNVTLLDEVDLWTGILLGDSSQQESAQETPLEDSQPGRLRQEVLNRSYTSVKCIPLPDGRLIEPFDVTVTAFFLKPVAPIIDDEKVDMILREPAFLHNSYMDAAGMVQFVSSFYRLHGEGEWNAIKIHDAFREQLDRMYEGMVANSYAQLDPDGTLTEFNPMDDLLLGYKEIVRDMGYAEIVEQIDITFTISPDAENSLRTELEGQSVFEYDDFTLEFTSVDFSAARVSICYAPKLSKEQRFSRPGSVEIFLKVLIDGREIECMGSLTSSGNTPDYGEGKVTGPAPVQIPDEITIIPYTYYGPSDDLQTKEYPPLRLKVKKIFE